MMYIYNWLLTPRIAMKKEKLLDYGIRYTASEGYRNQAGSVVNADQIKTIIETIDGATTTMAVVKKAMVDTKTAFTSTVMTNSSASLFKSSKHMKLIAKAYKPLPNSVDKALTKIFYYAISLDGKRVIYIRPDKTKDEYIPIQDVDDITSVEIALTKISVPGYSSAWDYLCQQWDKILITAESSLLNLLVNDEKEVEVRKYITEKFPCVAYRTITSIEVYYMEIEDTGEVVYTDVRVEGISGRPAPSFGDYLKLVFESYTSRLLTKIEKFPVPYSSVAGIPCHKHVDLAAIVGSGSHPDWDEYLARFTQDEGEVIKAFIWSIIDSRNKSRQGLYIYDNGYTAKSTLLDALATIIGDDQIVSLHKDSLVNQFGFAKVWDKRLVMLPDNKNPQIIRSEKMHMMLSCDAVDVEYKGDNSFRAQLNCRVIMSGNTLPQIDADAAHERTRLIIVKPKMSNALLKKIAVLDDNGDVKLDIHGNPIMIGDPGFKTRLIEQLKPFLATCKISYDKLCPNNGEIILPNSVLSEIYSLESVDSMVHNAYYNTQMSLDGEGTVSRIELYNSWMSWTKAEQYPDFATSMAYSNFVDWLIKVKKVSMKRMRDGDKRQNVFSGVTLKAPTVTISEWKKRGN